MKANYIQAGENIDYINETDKEVEAGDVILFGERIGIAGGNMAVGQLGALHMNGVFELEKAAGTAITAGAPVYYNAADDVITTTKTNNILAGYAVAAAAADAATVLVAVNA
jgi:predicted RecA/RadA family phage recombinase|nr:MAG TPA: protein of unknown function DUF2190 [Caudoviricetes sp.]